MIDFLTDFWDRATTWAMEVLAWFVQFLGDLFLFFQDAALLFSKQSFILIAAFCDFSVTWQDVEAPLAVANYHAPVDIILADLACFLAVFFTCMASRLTIKIIRG